MNAPSTMNAPSGGGLGQSRAPRLQANNANTGLTPPVDARSSPHLHPRQNGRPAPAETDSYQRRAALFEQEKRRIIDSCFAKVDDDGMQLESYITHVRVVEDGVYPSSPPPPDSGVNNKKNRVILVAVRRSGKVRVHKARENANGSFSIGKTWSLDELTAIQSYTGFQPSNPQERLERQWAGLVGFIVSLGKPYYWQATTAKEKEFFIASLVKIYRKYTGGRLPQLIGFPQHELDVLVGPGSGPQLQPASVSQSAGSRGGSGTLAQNGTPPPPPLIRPPSSHGQRPPTRSALRPDTAESDRPFTRDEHRPRPLQGPRRPSAENLPSPRLRPPVLASPLPRPDDQRSRPFGANRQPSAQELYAPRTPSRPDEALPAQSTESVAHGPDSGPSTPGTTYSDLHPIEPAPPVPKAPEQDVPERRRPPLADQQTSSAPSYNSQVIAPAKTPDYVTPQGTPGLAPIQKTISAESVRPHIPGQFPQPTPGSTGTDGYFDSASVNQSIDSMKALDNKAKSDAVPGPVQSPNDGETAEAKKTGAEFRPGLGPMMKKKSAKEIAAQFRKAAIAATAFQPRQGGAGARLRAMQDKQSDEPDGITSVVPAPLLRGLSADAAPPVSPVSDKERPSTPLANSILPKIQLLHTATEDSLSSTNAKPVTDDKPVTFAEPLQPAEPSRPVELEPGVELQKAAVPAQSLDQARSGSPQRRKRQRQELEADKFCSALGLDSRVLDGRGLDFNELLTEFGWEGRLKAGRKLEHFDSDVRREIGRAQATGWLGHLDQQENRLHDLARAFDKTIVECDEMDGLLTLYSHELNTLHDDIEYIEAQSQGLQVSTANQKLLLAELQSLLKTLTISSSDLEALRRAPLDDNEGIAAIERALILLHRAMLTIDPDIRSNRKRQEAASTADRTGVGIYADTDIGQMRAVRQKKEAYREESLTFVRRFNQHIIALFKLAEQRSSEELARTSASALALSARLPALQASRVELWVYSPMMLFIREVNSYEWQTLISSYEINIKSTYLDYFRDNTLAQRKNARKPTGEELEALFTHQDKDDTDKSLTSTAARKLTVKRSKTTKPTGLRQQLDHRRDGKPDASEIFDLVLQDQAKLVSEEQNFIVHLFHLSSSASVDFADEASKLPGQRAVPNLNAPLAYDADRDMAKIVLQAVEGIFQFWPSDLQALVEWVLRADQLQAVGVLCALERALATYEDTNQEYITRTLRQIHDRVTGLLHKFVDDQVRAIEETKVKVKKRKGVISFMRTLPLFIAALENMMPQELGQKDSLEVRFILNDVYGKILKAMWESLNFIAKDNPASGSGPQSHAPNSGGPEDKEALNYHILLIENMNHFIEEVDSHGNLVLEEWAEKAAHGLDSHLMQYSDAVIQRPLGKWLDFVESTEALMKVNDSSSYATIASKPSHSRSAAKKVLAAYDSRERVLDESGTRYAHAWDRMKTIIDNVYEGSLEIDWRKDEIVAMFKRPPSIMGQKIRVGIVGLSVSEASWGQLAHLPRLSKSPNYEIVALCNSSVANAEKAIKEFNLPSSTKAYDRYEDLANDPNVDLYVVTTRADTHYDIALHGLKAGKNTYVEWPLAATTQQAKELTELAKQKHVKTIVGLQGRVAPSIRKLKALVDSGYLGDVHSVNYHAAINVWQNNAVGAKYHYFLDRKVGANLLTIYGGHILDTIFYALGELKPAAYTPLLANLRPRMHRTNDDGSLSHSLFDKDTPDQILLHGRLDRNPPAVVSVHIRAGDRFIGQPGAVWRIYGTKGELAIEFASAGPQISAPTSFRFSNAATGKVEDEFEIDDGGDEWTQLPVQGQNIGRLYEAFAQGGGDYADFELALRRHQLLDDFWAAGF
ncbi:hypothetical protein DV736_g1824, partial [Chaetothyriales sp. CBS 134916]